MAFGPLTSRFSAEREKMAAYFFLIKYDLLFSDVAILHLHFNSFDYQVEIMQQETFMDFLCKFQSNCYSFVQKIR